MQTTHTTIPKQSEGLFRFILSELKPKGKVLTPFNIITGLIVLVGAVIIVIRFAKGLGAVTNLSQEYPWGIWIGFDVVTGVAFAGGAYVVTFLFYILKQDQYHSIVRATVLNGFLAYVFYAGALLLDLGRPWNVVNPIIGNSFGLSSILFLVAWHFMLYMFAQFIEISPAIAEWLGLERLRKTLKAMTIGAVIFGITLSTLHQSGLGALYLMAKTKIHPLWYSEFIPLSFFISSIFAGLSMVIFESSISHKVFHKLISPKDSRAHPGILTSLARICAGTIFVYMFLQILIFIHGKSWENINSPMGYWYLLENVGFMIGALILYLIGSNKSSLAIIRAASIVAIFGIILNRLNVTVIAFKWDEAVRYVPTWMEIEVTLAIICVEIWVFRWVVNRMPILNRKPEVVKTEVKKEKEVAYSHN